MFSARRLCVPLILFTLLGYTLTAVRCKAQDQPQDKSAQSKGPEKAAQKQRGDKTAAQLPVLLRRDPGDIASLDLVNGAGGAEHAPRAEATYVFTKEDMNGTSPKFYAKDDGGQEWLVKFGPEAKTETAATRLVWAMGYFTDEDYFLPRISVSRMPKLHRGSKNVAADGTMMDVRLKRQGSGLKTIQNWDWYDNPFLDTREFNGLRVLMALINNWDLTAVNNKVYATETEWHYLVADQGASFGRTGAVTTRSKGILKDYQDSKFIRERKANTVSFEMRTPPLVIFAPFEPKNYAKRSRMKQIDDNIPVADAAWIGGQLAKLTPQQIRDAFRTAGFSTDDVEGYSRAVQKRIAELNQLAP